MSTEPARLHLGHYRTWIVDAHNVIAVIGNFTDVRTSRHLYEERHHIPTVEDDRLERLMAACALSAASLADRESWGWTLTLPGLAEGWFCGVEPEGMLCARRRPADGSLSRALVQRQKGSGPLQQSHFEPRTDDPVDAVEQYFHESVQTATRIALGLDGTGLLIQALPGRRDDALFALDRPSLLATLGAELLARQERPLREFLVFYECRCDESMVADLLDRLDKEQQDELFDGTDSLTIECPRCGRSYLLGDRRNRH